MSLLVTRTTARALRPAKPASPACPVRHAVGGGGRGPVPIHGHGPVPIYGRGSCNFGAGSASEFLVSRPGVRAKVIDGARIAMKVRQEVSTMVRSFVLSGGRPPNLTVVLVGKDPASHTYVRNKRRAAKKCGIIGEVIEREESISEGQLLELIERLNQDRAVDGMLVQLPLPPHLDEALVCNAVRPEKDVDGFNVLNIGRYCAGKPAFIPATPLGVIEMLRRCGVSTFGKNVCIVGRSKNIGFALASLLHSDGKYSWVCGDATTTICHRYTPPEQLRVMTRLADVLIVATGVPGLVSGEMVKEGATVIDIGINRVRSEDGKGSKVTGDVVFEEVVQRAGLVTPVPGGVGPMTVAMLMRNTLDAARWKQLAK